MKRITNSTARSAAVAALLACHLALAHGCSDGPICPQPDDPADCGCAGPCDPGEACVDAVCVGNEDVSCGSDQETCVPGEHCVAGACVCDPEATKADAYACGCPPADCEIDYLDREICVEGQCVCNPDLHKENDGACGCPPEGPIACEEGSVCVDGKCQCQEIDHLNDSTECGCKGPCLDGKVCQSGACVCPPGTIACGEVCMPLGFNCCSLAGDACAPGSVCETEGDGATACRPAGTVPCYSNGGYAGFCASGEKCAVHEDGSVDCAPGDTTVCYADGFAVGSCAPGYTCTVSGGCLPPSWSLCSDGVTMCEPGSVCEISPVGSVCHPGDMTACHAGGLYTGACNAGETCHSNADGSLACVPAGMAGCHDQSGALIGVCDAGYTCTGDGACVPPSESLCADLTTTCEAGKTCELSADGYVCHPNGNPACFAGDLYVKACNPGESCHTKADQTTVCLPAGQVPCYVGGAYVGACPAGSSCTPNGACLPQGYSLCANGQSTCAPGSLCQHAANGYVCQPNGTTACFSPAGVYLGFCEAGYTCNSSGTKCVGPGASLCGDDQTICPSGKTCQLAQGGYVCHPNGATACYQNGLYVGLCDAGYSCAPGGGCLPPQWTSCGGGVSCAPGQTCQTTAGGHACQPTGTTACYDDSDYYTGFCDVGYTCNDAGVCFPPGYSLCADGITACASGWSCQHKSSGWVCQPPGTNACFWGSYYTHYCEAGYACGASAGSCVPPGWSECPDGSTCAAGWTCAHAQNGYTCYPPSTVPCWYDNYFVGWCEWGYICVGADSCQGP